MASESLFWGVYSLLNVISFLFFSGTKFTLPYLSVYLFLNAVGLLALSKYTNSSKELVFFNPRSQLNSTVGRIAPCSSKIERTGKGEREREGYLGRREGEKLNPS